MENVRNQVVSSGQMMEQVTQQGVWSKKEKGKQTAHKQWGVNTTKETDARQWVQKAIVCAGTRVKET